jgi:hypothetical protein
MQNGQRNAMVGIINLIMFYFKIAIEGPFTIWAVIGSFRIQRSSQDGQLIDKSTSVD